MTGTDLRVAGVLVAVLLGAGSAWAAPQVGQTHDPAWGGHGMVVAGEGSVPGRTEFRIWSPLWDQMDKDRAAAPTSGSSTKQTQDAEQQALRQRLMACLGRPLPALPAAPPPNSMACPGNPDRGKFPAVVVAGRDLMPVVEEDHIRQADLGVWLGAATIGADVRRNAFTAMRYEMVRDLGKDTLLGAATDKTDWHSYWPAGLNIELLPERPWLDEPRRE
jgi:hypothetical protein